MGIEEGTCWDEHWVSYGNQFDNKFHILKKEKIERALFYLLLALPWVIRLLSSPFSEHVFYKMHLARYQPHTLSHLII